MWYFVLQTAVATVCGYALTLRSCFTLRLVIVLWLQDAVSQSKCWLRRLGLVRLCRGCFHSCCTVLLLYCHCASTVLAVTALLTNSTVCCRLNLFRQTTISLKNNWQPWKVRHFSASFHFAFSVSNERFSFPVFFFMDISAALFLATLVMEALETCYGNPQFPKGAVEWRRKQKSRKLK